ncbi:asparagine synthase-domain-containing protein [Spinellus fusiger]|nr:asparagine synthase-domain-containing protein [Spinellus fusiger]
MCGILFSLSTVEEKGELWESLKELNRKRGPDVQQMHLLKVPGQTTSIQLQFYSSVLHLRGEKIVPQPIKSHTGDLLSWNGEIFGGLEVEPGTNDTQALIDVLNQIPSDNTSEKAVLDIFARIEGPFAFVFWQKSTNRLWFGRDCLGRRSLLWTPSKDKKQPFFLSSVCPPSSTRSDTLLWEEVPANSIYCIQLGQEIHPEQSLDQQPSACGYPLRIFPWTDEKDTSSDILSMSLPFPRINTCVPDTIDTEVRKEDPVIDLVMEKAIQNFTRVLSESVRRRVADVPYLSTVTSYARVAVLFSGGLDCISLAALAHQHLPCSEPIDLLNVAFENPRREQALQKPKKIKKTKNMKPGTVDTTEVKDELSTPAIAPVKEVSVYDTPDRITGRAGVSELRKIAPNRIWNFVEINVPYKEAMSHRQAIIDLMYPLDTVMDLSIAMAFWFASRGKGVILIQDTEQTYHSHARVLLSGLGADEQLGGYSRHKEAFRHNGWEGVMKETQLDVDRISTRNLGRDDRIMSDHGKEVRFPFLSTDVVRWLCECPIHIKMDLRYERGIGEKLLLRHVARTLGLTEASRNWKRAIQFGAKTAKMTDSSRAEKGQHKLI